MSNRTADAIRDAGTRELIELEESMATERVLPGDLQHALRNDVSNELMRRYKAGDRPAREIGRISGWLSGGSPVRAGENVR